ARLRDAVALSAAAVAAPAAGDVDPSVYAELAARVGVESVRGVG
ncbi:1-phosphofructokinase, partial [Streptomyces sp. SID3343]|nr:1-phosphofructokinase [Streptomyces sp. SID3343]